MATQLQIRRGTTAQMNAFTGAEGELAVNTTTDTVHVHDGSTAGGFALAKADGSNIGTYAGSFTTLAASGAVTLSSTLAVSGTATMDRLGLGVAAHASAALLIDTTDQHIRLANGSELGVIELDSDGELNIWAHGDGETINFKTGSGAGTDVLSVVGSNVGIGTSSPSGPLDVVSSSGSVGVYIRGRSSDNFGSLYFTSNASASTEYGYIQGRPTDLRIQGFNNGLILNPTGGNVGIGTSSPNQLLTVGNSSGGATVSISTDQAAGSIGSKKYMNLDFSGYANTVMARIQSWDESSSTGNGYLTFHTTPSGGSVTERMRIDSSGQLSLATTEDKARMTIGLTGVAVTGDTDGATMGENAIVHLLDSNSAATNSTVMLLGGGGGATGQIKSGIGFSRENAGNWGTQLRFYTHSTATSDLDELKERMRIDSAGRVTMPYQPAFSVAAATQNNIPINANTTVNFNNEVFDQGSNYAGTLFTAPVTGKYQLNVIIYAQSVDSAADYVQIALVTSNHQYYSIFSTTSLDQDAAYMTFPIAVLADMDALDTAYVEVQLNNTGASQMDINANSYFSGYLVA